MIQKTYDAIIRNPLFIYKCASTFVQLYIASLIATNGSSEEPWLALKTIAHLGALLAGLRGLDALIDPAFRQLVSAITDDDKKKIAAETTP